MKCEYCNKEFKNLGVHQKTCKEKPVNDKEPKETPETSNNLEKRVDELASNLNTLADAVSKLVKMQEQPTAQLKTTPEQEPVKDETIDNSYLPPRYREIVDNILSPEFGAKVTDFEDRTDFQFTIIVPQKYSSLSKEQYEEMRGDIRSRIIPRGLGENGVRDWCKLVRTNLNKYYSKEGMQSPFTNSGE